MSTPNPPPSSQGSTVSFNGQAIGRLVRWRTVPGTAKFSNINGNDAQVVGTGANSRIVEMVDCTAIEPGGADVTLREVPSFVLQDIGKKASLSVTHKISPYNPVTKTWPTKTVTFEAFLEGFDGAGNVGQFLEGTIRFRFSGVTT